MRLARQQRETTFCGYGVRAAAYSAPVAESERCWRCSAEMEWRHGTWQCPRCRLKLGCCEGEPQDCGDVAADPVRVESARR